MFVVLLMRWAKMDFRALRFFLSLINYQFIMKTVINPQTNNPEVQFEGKLLSVSSNVLNLNNEKQTPYRVATIQYANADGVVKTASAIIYEANFKYGVTPGLSYLCRAIKTPGQTTPLVTMSHLVATERASFDDFNFDAVEEAEQVISGESGDEDIV